MSKTRIEMVYAGLHRHQGELLHLYYPINRRTGALQDEAYVYREPFGEFEVGAVCSFQTPDDGATVLPEDVRLVRTWRDPSQIQEWNLRHSTVSASEAAWTKRLPDDVFACAYPLRESYRKLDREGQTLLIAQLVRWLCVES